MPTSASDLVRAYNLSRRNTRLFAALADAESDETTAAIYRRISLNESNLSELWRAQIQSESTHTTRSWSPTVTLTRVASRLTPKRLFAGWLQRRHRRWIVSNSYTLDEKQSREHIADTSKALHELTHQGGSTVEHDESGSLANRTGAIRAGVLGMNDGLVSNFSLTMGIAGATADPNLVLLTGLAGLLAGALSMAAGEYVSVKSQNEYYESLIEWERAELAMWPEEETDELARLFESKGLNGGEAKAVATRLMSDSNLALDVHVREELGINPDDLGGNPWTAAVSSLLAFACGAFVPVIPYVFGTASVIAILISATASVATLLSVGATLGWMSGTNVLGAGIRMAAIGCAAAALTYLLGSLVGTQLN